MFMILTTSSLAAPKVMLACGTFVHAQTDLKDADVTLAERCVR
jgi:hypothetical protein